MAAFPIGVHFIVLMSNGRIHSQMPYAFLCVFLLPIVLLETARATGAAEMTGAAGGRRAHAMRAASIVTALCISASLYSYIWQDNGVAMMISHTNQQVMHYFSDLRTRIQSTPGYRPDARLAIVGERFDDPTRRNVVMDNTWFDEQANFEAFLEDSWSNWSWWPNALGFAQPQVSEEELREIEQLERVREMPYYPADGSIAMIGEDVIVLKLKPEGE